MHLQPGTFSFAPKGDLKTNEAPSISDEEMNSEASEPLFSDVLSLSKLASKTDLAIENVQTEGFVKQGASTAEISKNGDIPLADDGTLRQSSTETFPVPKQSIEQRDTETVQKFSFASNLPTLSHTADKNSIETRELIPSRLVKSQTLEGEQDTTSTIETDRNSSLQHSGSEFPKSEKLVQRSYILSKSKESLAEDTIPPTNTELKTSGGPQETLIEDAVQVVKNPPPLKADRTNDQPLQEVEVSKKNLTAAIDPDSVLAKSKVVDNSDKTSFQTPPFVDRRNTSAIPRMAAENDKGADHINRSVQRSKQVYELNFKPQSMGPPDPLLGEATRREVGPATRVSETLIGIMDDSLPFNLKKEGVPNARSIDLMPSAEGDISPNTHSAKVRNANDANLSHLDHSTQIPAMKVSSGTTTAGHIAQPQTMAEYPLPQVPSLSPSRVIHAARTVSTEDFGKHSDRASVRAKTDHTAVPSPQDVKVPQYPLATQTQAQFQGQVNAIYQQFQSTITSEVREKASTPNWDEPLLGIGSLSGADTDQKTGQTPVSANVVTKPISRGYVMMQLADATRTLSSGQSLQIELDPVELGRVRLSLNASDGAMSMLVVAERGETADLLRRNIDMLEQELLDLGYEDVNFEFENQDAWLGSENSGGTSDFSSPPDSPKTATENVQKPDDYIPIVSNDRLDIRL